MSAVSAAGTEMRSPVRRATATHARPQESDAAGANLRETARRLALEYTYLSRRLMDVPAQQ